MLIIKIGKFSLTSGRGEEGRRANNLIEHVGKPDQGKDFDIIPY